MAAALFTFLVLVVWTAAVQFHPTTTTRAIVEDVQRSEFERDRNGETTRIVAGWPAVDGQFPYQVSLRMINNVGEVSSCGGSIIHHQWVLTAAHCVANQYTFVVRIGLTNLTRTEYILESTRRYLHPSYWEPWGDVQTDDIALVGLDQYITYNSFIQPCRLQPSSVKNADYTGVVLTGSGYGMTDDAWNGGTTSETLNWVYLRGISNELCMQFYPEAEDFITCAASTCPIVCAEYYNHTSQSACRGDSGGPLTYVDFDGRPTMVGVSSFVSLIGCNSIYPSGWIRPGHYHSWFRQITGVNFDWTISADGTVNYNYVEFADPDPLRPVSFRPQDFGPMKPST